MKKISPVIWLLVLVVILVIIVCIIINNSKNKANFDNNQMQNKEEFTQVVNEEKQNISSKLHEIKKIEGLEIGNINLTYAKGLSKIEADVNNTSSSVVQMMEIKVTLLDKNEKKLVSIDGLIKKLEPGQKCQINMSANGDYTNAYDFTIVKK